MEIRRLTTADDLKSVARLIYCSDDYIYPYLFDNDIQVAERVLVNMITGATLYNYKDIYVALSSGEIIAMMIVKTAPLKIDHEEIIKCFVAASVPVGARFARVFNEYFKLLEDEPPDIYIANIAVDKLFRGMGVGRSLMQSVLDSARSYHLEVVQANTNAVKLYKKLGFKIDCKYPGFTGVPCYRMTRQSKGE